VLEWLEIYFYTRWPSEEGVNTSVLAKNIGCASPKNGN